MQLHMRLTFALSFCLSCTLLSAQESPFAKFGKVKPEHLQTKVYSLDSSAAAVVLSDVGQRAIEGNSKGWFSVLTNRHKVVHILNKSAYDEATVEIALYVNGSDEERLEDLKGVTYNLEGGKLVETKLEKSNVFTEKRDKHIIIKKFTFPAVKEGSIIEYQYSVKSDFIHHVDPWYFQSDVPSLWSEFAFSVPQFFTYGTMMYGYIRPTISDRKDRAGSFTIVESQHTGPSQTYTLTSNITDYRWVMKDVPELKGEAYTSTPANHVARLEFQLSSQNMPLTPRNFRSSWTGLTKELLDAEFFGSGIKGSNGWVADDVKRITAGAAGNSEKAKRIYTFVRDHITCTRSSGIGVEQSPKATFKAGKGTVAEINLLLTAMLRSAGITADPVILSKVKHGYAYDIYPMLSRFNYVVIRVQDGEKEYYLDASHPHLGFGKLLPECYNGHARIVNEEATPVYLLADSLRERKVTALFFTKGKNALWEGSMDQMPGYYESYHLRERITTDGKETFFKEVQRAFGSEVQLSDTQVDSLNNYEQPVQIKYKLAFNPESQDVLYVNPMFGEGYKKNPFKSAVRQYPVEMPNASDETYLLTMEVPEGYTVDELPKQIVVKLDEAGKSFFEYRVQVAGSTLSLRSRIKLDRAYYEPDEYENLREFFNLVVKKHGEQVVFKRTKAATAGTQK